MAIVADAARDADSTQLCANEAYQNAPETWNIGFSLLASVAETPVTDTATSPFTADAPTTDFSAFWLTPTADTDRPAHIPPSGSVGN